MKRLVCLVSTLAVVALAVGAGSEDTPTIKDVMDKLHKGANAPLAKLKTALKSDSPDWKNVQDLTKDFVNFGAALAKNEPPRGEKADFDKLANAYLSNAKALDEAAKAEDKAKAKAALDRITASCKTCHAAHKGQ
jgi:mono/diheme cytochrome c family protein